MSCRVDILEAAACYYDRLAADCSDAAKVAYLRGMAADIRAAISAGTVPGCGD